ncbi:MAG: PAS domain S-box protein [Hydrogenophaga sp.]|nr:PAS domain S-box protein [Hydrogenophaga sp.]
MPPLSGHTSPAEALAPEPQVVPPGADTADQERTWLRALSIVAIGLFLLLAIGLLLTQRTAALDMANAQAQRESQRLANELQASLRVAKASMDLANGSPRSGRSQLLEEQRPLVETLNLPFGLDLGGPATAGQPTGQWLPGLARETAGRWVVPLAWHFAPAEGGRSYEVLLDRQALLNRFASESLPPGGSMSLFRVEADGDTTVLARYPFVESEQGRTLRSHVADALAERSSGVIQGVARLDGVHRIVGYQRLTEGAERLVMVYALPVADVLAAWTTMLPLAIAFTLLVAGAMAYGARRLDLAVHQLRRSERHFQALSDNLPDIVMRYNRSGQVLYANPAVEAATGIKPDAMRGQTLEQFGTPPELASLWMFSLDRVFETGTPETLRYVMPGPFGERHWESQILREPKAKGEKPTALVICRDITESHEAEARRLSAQQLFETVFQSAPEAMSLSEWDTGRLLLVNDAFCELFGRPRDQLIGHSAIDLNLWQTLSTRDQLIGSLERGEQVRHAAANSTRPDGTLIHVRYSAERVQQNGMPCLLLMFRNVTQLESDQRTLARSELRFRLAAAHGQVWEWDFERGFLEPSDEFFSALGHTIPPTDQMGRLFFELIHPEDLPRQRMVLRAFFKGKADYQLEFRVRDAEGRYRWFDTRGSGLRDALGRVTYMAGTTFDISDRKALEEAQRQTLVRLETLTNASEALLWTSRADGLCDWVNQRWLDFTGQVLDDVVGDGWTSHVHPDDLPQIMRIYDDAREEREPYSSEFRLRNTAGEYRWLLDQSYPRYDADNRFIGYICSCVDVTELKQAEAIARERGAMLEQVFDVLQDMLFVVDEQERFVHYHAGRKDMLYAPPEQFLGRAFADVMPPDQTIRLREAMARARSQGLQELEYSLALPDGTHTFNTRLAWLPDSGHCMFLVRDVTERQAAQLERERLNQFVFLLFGLANRFINLPVQQADAAINEALGDMGRFVDADRAYLLVRGAQPWPGDACPRCPGPA